MVFIAYSFVTLMLPCVAVYFLYEKRYRMLHIRARMLFLLLVLAAYMCGVIYFTGAGTLFDYQRYGFANAGGISTEIFWHAFDSEEYLLNIIMLVPFGILVPFIWPSWRNIFAVTLAGCALSVCIEASQLLNNRATDIDDIIANTLGALIGYILYRVFALIMRRPGRTAGRGGELIIYMAAMWLGHFLLYNELGLARRLYGF